ncbi:MAG: LptA/OstA family protein, partial [Psittacicella sp.]
MKNKIKKTTLIVLIGSILYGSVALANATESSDSSESGQNSPVYISSDVGNFNIKNNNLIATYMGNVHIKQNEQNIYTNHASVYKFKEGNVFKKYAVIDTPLVYSNGVVKAQAKNAYINLLANQSDIKNIKYTITVAKEQNPLRGNATNAYFGNTYRILKEASITSCPIGDNSWYVKASTIKNNIKHKYADLYNPRFYIKGV